MVNYNSWGDFCVSCIRYKILLFQVKLCSWVVTVVIVVAVCIHNVIVIIIVHKHYHQLICFTKLMSVYIAVLLIKKVYSKIIKG